MQIAGIIKGKPVRVRRVKCCHTERNLHFNEERSLGGTRSSISVFKQNIATRLEMENLSGISFDIRDFSHQGFLSEVLIQMRFEPSPLRSHLFKYNLIDNPFCPTCGDFFETTDHYFSECNYYCCTW